MSTDDPTPEFRKQTAERLRLLAQRMEEHGSTEFLIDGEDIHMADWALQRLEWEARADTYVRARMLCRLGTEATPPKGVFRPAGAPFIEPLPAPALRDRLARLGQWTKHKSKGKKVEITPTIPPPWMIENIMSRSSWSLNPLEGIMETPTIRPDGSVLATNGYDSDTGILMKLNTQYLPIPESPTQEEVAEAGQRLLEPFKDFPFRETSDRAAAVAAILSIIARPAFPGPVPMFVFRAPAPGTGKSLLADAISLIATGRSAPHMAPPEKDEELRKFILSIGLEGIPIVVIDNVAGQLGSPALSSVLTSTTWKDRLLGVNKTVETPITAVWMATGNNITFKGDLGRRVVVSDLDSGVEHPEDRLEASFSHYPLLTWISLERASLVRSALILLRAYHVAGRPKHGAPQKGSFEGWDSLIRGCLIWCGIGDPDEGKERVRDEDDTDISSMATLLRELDQAFYGYGFSCAEAIDKAKSNQALQDAISGATDDPRADAARLGYTLRSGKDRIFEGLKLTMVKTKSKREAKKWLVSGGDRGDVGSSLALVTPKITI